MEANKSYVLEVPCKEKEGTIVRRVNLCELTIDKLRMFWDKLKEFDLLFNDFVRGDTAQFVSHFIVQIDGEIQPTGLIWEVDDIGIFILTDLVPMHTASCHFVFWDKKFRGREKLCQEMIKYVFDRYQFRRLKLEIPLFALHTLLVADRIGFVREGRLRKNILFKGEWYDTNVYSMIPEDLDSLPTEFHTQPAFSTGVCRDCGDKYRIERTYRKKELLAKGVPNGS